MTDEYALARATHCYVNMAREDWRAALLLTWRAGRSGWEAQVIVADRGTPDGRGPTVDLRWVPAARVRDAHGRPASTP